MRRGTDSRVLQLEKSNVDAVYELAKMTIDTDLWLLTIFSAGAFMRQGTIFEERRTVRAEISVQQAIVDWGSRLIETRAIPV